MPILGGSTVNQVRVRSVTENGKLRDSIAAQAKSGGTSINNRNITIMRNEEKGIIILYCYCILLQNNETSNHYVTKNSEAL